jgi:hypothetical protein
MSLVSGYRPSPTTVKCDNPKCNALYEISNLLGGHTFTCNQCGSKVTVRDISTGAKRDRVGHRFVPFWKWRTKPSSTPLLDAIVSANQRSPISRRVPLTILGALLSLGFLVYMVESGEFATLSNQLRRAGSKAEPQATPSPSGSMDLNAGLVRSLPNGTRLIKDLSAAGSGELTVINGTPTDACVILLDVNTNTRIRMVYVRAHDLAVLRHLSAGSYRALFTVGSDWDDGSRRFTRDSHYFDFGKTLIFEETRDSRSIHYSTQTITLNDVPEGNVRSAEIPENLFGAYSGR